MNNWRDNDGYVMPLTAWLMFTVLVLMAFMWEGGRLLNQTRHASLVADTAARQVTQIIDLEALRFSAEPELAEQLVIEETVNYLAAQGYNAEITVDAQSRVVNIRAYTQWNPGALQAIGLQPREISGTSTGVSLRGITEPEDP